MRKLGFILVGLIAALHVLIAGFEMFLWESKGPEVFTVLPADLYDDTAVLALNQGLYNGFLAAGLIWALLIKDRLWQWNVAVCFLLFVAVAGLVGAFSASMTILYVQFVPAAAALVLLWLSRD